MPKKRSMNGQKDIFKSTQYLAFIKKEYIKFMGVFNHTSKDAKTKINIIHLSH